jgi:phospholipase C
MPAAQIDHVVVLMLENRSFDHMLGWPDVQGRQVPFDPNNLSLGYASVFPLSGPEAYETTPDPGHELVDVNLQLFGTEDPEPGATPTNDGFVLSYSRCRDEHGQAIGPAKGQRILGCMTSSAVPVIRRLAEEFLVCDRWFASVPGPTWPNRDFVHAGTSMGHADSPDHGQMFWGYPHVRTIYHSLMDAGRTWKVYYHDFPQAFWFRDLLDYKDTNFAHFDQVTVDVRSQTLANYSFIEPRYFTDTVQGANDEHPPHDVRLGEALIAAVYNSLRASQLWNHTLFILVYDEHGGFYDHVAPQMTVNPDGQVSSAPSFAFDRLGVRVPALLISPWVGKHVIDNTVYDHTSILGFLKKNFGLGDFLHRRDAMANTFEHNFLQSPRDDCPTTINVSISNGPLTRFSRSPSTLARRPLSDFQKALVALASSLSHPRRQHEAAAFIANQMSKFGRRRRRRPAAKGRTGPPRRTKGKGTR